MTDEQAQRERMVRAMERLAVELAASDLPGLRDELVAVRDLLRQTLAAVERAGKGLGAAGILGALLGKR